MTLKLSNFETYQKDRSSDEVRKIDEYKGRTLKWRRTERYTCDIEIGPKNGHVGQLISLTI